MQNNLDYSKFRSSGYRNIDGNFQILPVNQDALMMPAIAYTAATIKAESLRIDAERSRNTDEIRGLIAQAKLYEGKANSFMTVLEANAKEWASVAKKRPTSGKQDEAGYIEHAIETCILRAKEQMAKYPLNELDKTIELFSPKLPPPPPMTNNDVVAAIEKLSESKLFYPQQSITLEELNERQKAEREAFFKANGLTGNEGKDEFENVVDRGDQDEVESYENFVDRLLGKAAGL
jgi:hypothetical protein